MSKVKIDEVPFTNRKGQTINVGDEVFSVTASYAGSTTYRKSKYIGMTGKSVRLEWFEPREESVDENGNVLSFGTIWAKADANVPQTELSRARRYDGNRDRAVSEEYRRLVNQVYSKKTVQVRRVSKLHYNRIYPIGSSVTDLL